MAMPRPLCRNRFGPSKSYKLYCFGGPRVTNEPLTTENRFLSTFYVKYQKCLTENTFVKTVLFINSRVNVRGKTCWTRSTKGR